jgi:Tol biopolymer transport system component
MKDLPSAAMAIPSSSPGPNVKFTPDGKKLCYRILKGSSPASDPSELRVLDLESGRSQPLLPGFPVTGRWGVAYDISRDGQKVVVAVVGREGKYRLWIAPLDRRSAPHQVANVEGQRPVFGPAGQIYFRAIQGASSWLYQVNEDGTGLRPSVTDDMGAYATGISPDGKWLAVMLGGGGGGPLVVIYPISGGPPVPILGPKSCSGDPIVRWSPDGRLLIVSVPTTALDSTGRTYFIPLPHGRLLPEIPTGGFQSEADIARLPGVRRVDEFDVTAGSRPGVYAFARESVQRNLFRVPLQ